MLGGGRLVLKMMRAVRSPLWGHCFPKPALPGGSIWAWILAWAGGEGAARAGSGVRSCAEAKLPCCERNPQVKLVWASEGGKMTQGSQICSTEIFLSGSIASSLIFQ